MFDKSFALLIIMIDESIKMHYTFCKPTVSLQKGATFHMRIIKEPEERKTEILDTAEHLFITKGYGKTTINDILKEIGIAKGTFYYYFKSKEEVMNAIVLRFVSVGVRKAREIVADNTLTAHEKITAFIYTMETILGAEKGSFAFAIKCFDQLK